MIANKKDFYGPEIKKYKKKRLHIIDQIKQVKDKFIHIQN